MTRRLREREPEVRRPPEPAGERVVIPVDPVSEAAVLVHALHDHTALDQLLRKLVPDQFLVREHREAWAALAEVRRRGLTPDRASVGAVAGEHVAEYLLALLAASSPPENVAWHVGNMLWDGARATAARGPVSSFLEALRDPRAEPDRVRSLARQIAASFDGHEDRKHLLDGRALVREQMLEIEARLAGRAAYPYGIPGLDHDEDRGRRRMIPGTAPGQITVLTATSGSGKSTTAANMTLGIAFPGGVHSGQSGRKVLYCAWEMSGGMTAELLACISLGWSREDLMDPQGAPEGSPVRTREGRLELQAEMDAITERVTFLAMPFRRKPGEKPSNDRNLDVLQGYIADAGCDVVIADLWKRCLRDASPEAEEDALIRQQVMVEDARVHLIALQQQRLKDIETRPSKRPTRDGIKGSGAWIEVADTILGVHRPALWKRMDDVTLEIDVLKQRYGRWPLAIEFTWDPERGSIKGGREVEYDRGLADENPVSAFIAGPPVGRRRRKS